MIDLSKFVSADYRSDFDGDKFYLSYVNSPTTKQAKVCVSKAVTQKFLSDGVEKAKLMISKDNKVVALVPSPNGVKLQRKHGGVSFGSGYLVSIFKGISPKQGIRLEGVYDEETKGFVFPIENPFFY